MAAHWPDRVLLVHDDELMARPEATLGRLLKHLSATTRAEWPMLYDAVHLARSEHLAAIEKELGYSLDRTRVGGQSHMTGRRIEEEFDSSIRAEVFDRLSSMNIDVRMFESVAPHATKAVTTAG
jgi:hypothetical protein